MGPISELIGANKYLLSLRDGFMLAFPATMFGSIMVILQNLPTTFGFGGFLPKWFNTFLTDFFGPVGNATMSVSALFIVFGIGYQLAGHYGQQKIFAGAISLSSFLMLLPIGTVICWTIKRLMRRNSTNNFAKITKSVFLPVVDELL
ncbi:hypothetical protein CPEBRM1_ABPJDJAI_02491 [Companilactobacillus paralimentarius]